MTVQTRASRWVAGLGRREGVYLTLLLGLTLFLAFYNLEGYPAFTSMDEGHKLSFAKSYLLHGRYAILTTAGFGPFAGGTGSGSVNAGLTLMAPVILALKIFGLELWPARLVIAIFFVGAVLALYYAVRYLYRSYPVAWLASFFWFVALRRESGPLLLTASVFFGLAVLTKEFFAPIIVGTLVGIYLVDRLGRRDLRWPQIIWPIVFCALPIIGWRFFLASQVGGPESASTELAGASALRLFVFSPPLIYESLKFLAEHNYILWAVPALFYAIFVALTRNDHQATTQQLFFPFFVIIWMLWYIIASIGWPRYAYPGWAITSVPLAKFLYDLFQALAAAGRDKIDPGSRWAGWLRQLHTWPALLLIAILLFWPAQNTVRRVVSGDNEAAKAFAHYIDTQLPAEAVIASEELEIDFLSSRIFLHRPSELDDVFIKYLQLGQPLEATYDVAAYDPDFIVSGPYNKGVGFIEPEFLARHCELVVSIGEYDLYRLLEP